MADFEQSVADFAKGSLDDQYAALAALDPAAAKQFARAIDTRNAGRIRRGAPLATKGTISMEEVDDILDTILGADNTSKITKNEELAVCMMLAIPDRPDRWERGAKNYMTVRIEEKLRDLYSVRPIAGNIAAGYLSFARHIQFDSGGEKHKGGSGNSYAPQDYQDVLTAIRTSKMNAWTIPSDGMFARILPPEWGVTGIHYSDANNLFLVNGLSNSVRAAAFVHEATHAIQDFSNRNSPDMYLEADAYIADATAAWTYGVPYYGGRKSPEEVATRGAAKLLMERTRGKNWGRDFRLAYDDVVEAVIALFGKTAASKVKTMREAESTVADEEFALLTRMHKAVKKK